MLTAHGTSREGTQGTEGLRYPEGAVRLRKEPEGPEGLLPSSGTLSTKLTARGASREEVQGTEGPQYPEGGRKWGNPKW